uniref:Tyrosine-protein phosphatase domain-containing protein n=1 Tax=Rhabditophanes sp. KR3021 TaxID=114890 RepID=A0AC35TZS6_9BILA
MVVTFNLQSSAPKPNPMSASKERPKKIKDKTLPSSAFQKTSNIQEWFNTLCRGEFKEYCKAVRAKQYRRSPAHLTCEAMDLEPLKGRYEDVICYDQSRVVLKREFGKVDPDDKDFIHANWIITPGTRTKYILCQGPLENTIPDMWEMMFQERVSIIVMVCQCVEDGLQKCEKYWPETNETYGYYKVENLGDVKSKWLKDMHEVEVRELSITAPNNVRHKLLHMVITNIGDHLASQDPNHLCKLSIFAKKYAYDKNGPIATHCSAGIGRSGLFAAIQYVYEGMMTSDSTDPMQLVKEMRACRKNCLQTYLQYACLNMCLANLFIRKKLIRNGEEYKTLLKKYNVYFNVFMNAAKQKKKATKRFEKSLDIEDGNKENEDTKKESTSTSKVGGEKQLQKPRVLSKKTMAEQTARKSGSTYLNRLQN